MHSALAILRWLRPQSFSRSPSRISRMVRPSDISAAVALLRSALDRLLPALTQLPVVTLRPCAPKCSSASEIRAERAVRAETRAERGALLTHLERSRCASGVAFESDARTSQNLHWHTGEIAA